MVFAACARTPDDTSAGRVPAHPPTPTVDVVDDYHGTRVADPYRWLEEVGKPEVRDWAAAQTRVTTEWLNADTTRAALLARLRRLAEPFDAVDAFEEPPGPEDSVAIRLVRAPGGTHQVLARVVRGRAPTVLVDPRRDGRAREITSFTPSPDGRFVAYDLSEGGSEWVETRIVRVGDRRDLPEVLRGLLWDPPAWTRDGRGFLYVHHERSPEGGHVMFHDPSVRYHVVGTPQSSDRVLLATPAGSVEFVLSVQLLGDGRYALMHEGTGADWDGLGQVQSQLHLLDLRNAMAPDLSGVPRPLLPDRNHAYHVVAERDSVLYLFTDRGAPRHRLVAVTLGEPDPSRWRTVIPESEEVLHRVEEIDGRLVTVSLRDVQHRVRVYDFDGRLLHEPAVPPMSAVYDVQAGTRSGQLRVLSSGLTRPPSIVQYDLSNGSDTALVTPSAVHDSTRLEARQVWYPAKDGTRIPMFLVHRRDLPKDGARPTLIYGYGASGTTVTPTYDEQALAWAEQGGVFAQPALRGGGEFGRAWYDAAILDRKQTTFDDMIAAAEWLVAEGYASPATLGMRGGSNGGLLVTAVLTQRPDLFRAVVAEVPMTDALRYDRGRHRAQFGWPGDPKQFPFLYAYSPLHRVRSGTCYPAVLVTTALNDERAPAWQAFKFVAAMQAAQSCARPVLLRADTAGGHAGGSTPDSWLQGQVDGLTFLARALGLGR